MRLIIYPALIIFFQTSSHIMIKLGLNRDYRIPILPLNLYTMIGYTGIVVNFLVWIRYLKIERLSIATAATSLVYITFPIGAYFILGEKLTIWSFLGFILLLTSVIIINFSTN